jgi:hypothetical protein
MKREGPGRWINEQGRGVLRSLKLFAIIFCLFFLTGWTHEIALKDTSELYEYIMLKGAPLIQVSDMDDRRGKGSKIGRIGSLRFLLSGDIEEALSDRIAVRLMTKGFNVRKETPFFLNDKSVVSELRKSGIDLGITGDVYRFFFDEIDPVTEDMIGKSIFSVRVLSQKGEELYNGYYFLSVRQNITEAPLSGSEELVRRMVGASVDVLFADKRFLEAVGAGENKARNDLPEGVYYERELTEEIYRKTVQVKNGDMSRKALDRYIEENMEKF